MQRIAGVLLILWGLGWLASEMPSMHDRAPPSAAAWRRTSVGWERVDRLEGIEPPRPPVVHPAVFALGMLLFALSGLIGLTPDQHVAHRDLPPR